MATFISIPFKKTNEVDLVKPLKNLISTYCSTADEPVDCTDALNELEKLRMNSTWRTLDKHEGSLDTMCRIPFKWKDAFDKGTFFGGSTSLTLSSLTYERICILFNIAAMQSQLATSLCTDSKNDTALKSAAKYYQLAGGIFNYLKNNVSACIQQEPTPDLQPDTLSALAAIMLAQAQESFFLKATADKMKDAVIAKVASQCEELYADALRQMQKDTLKVTWEKDYIPIIAGKQAAFHAIAEYHQALVCKQKSNIGEEIARLSHAQDLMKAAENRAGINFNYKDYVGQINRLYEETKKDNDFIYHERVPDVKSLAPIGKASLAKPLPLSEHLSSNYQDLFSNLLPVSVQQALQTFDVRKTEIVNNEIGSLREQTQMLNGILASLNLPAAIEDISGDSLPQSIKDKASTVRMKGGIEFIQRLINELPALLERNKQILDEAERMLNEEQQSDEQLLSQFKEKWTRTRSSKLNEPLRASCNKYRSILDRAVSADHVVQEKFGKHKSNIELLCRTDEEIQAAIPSSSPVHSSNSSAVDRLKQLMDQVDALRSEREVLESELKSATTDMKSKFMSALSEDGAINEHNLSVETLGEVFGLLQKQVRDSIAKQETLTAQIQEANTEFCNSRSGDRGTSQRDAKLSELASAYDAFMELTSNLEEGTKFYEDLTYILIKFQNQINDFTFARNTEKEDLCRELQRNIANQAAHPTPSLPEYHKSTEDQSKFPSYQGFAGLNYI
ncbi:programmed cell death 6-interacting protein-like [Centruroides sculpturatus]|uniref:programmed cell death 6-interacting protein-like n=1 Tax=Centruroides sculpturatus TaxID=218467 RepID=UPI000C6C91E7|nr:programmed cell death 6-interacting protein-like [Centruroides sculpturatus]